MATLVCFAQKNSYWFDGWNGQHIRIFFQSDSSQGDVKCESRKKMKKMKNNITMSNDCEVLFGWCVYDGCHRMPANVLAVINVRRECC